MVSRESRPLIHKVTRKSPRNTSYDGSLNAIGMLRVDHAYQTYLDGYLSALGNCESRVDLRQESITALDSLPDPSKLLWDMFYQGDDNPSRKMAYNSRTRKMAAAVILESLTLHFSSILATGCPKHLSYMHPVIGICQLIGDAINENYIMSFGVRSDSFLCPYFIENPSFLALMVHYYNSPDFDVFNPDFSTIVYTQSEISAFSEVKHRPADRVIPEKALSHISRACHNLMTELSRDWYVAKYHDDSKFDPFYPVPPNDNRGGGGAAAFNYYQHKWDNNEYGHNRGQLLWHTIKTCRTIVGDIVPVPPSKLWLISHTIGQTANRSPMNGTCKDGSHHVKIKFRKAG